MPDTAYLRKAALAPRIGPCLTPPHGRPFCACFPICCWPPFWRWAAAVRFYRLGAVSFTFDAAAVSNLAAQWIDQGRLPLQGMVSSTGFRNPPLTVYLISLPLRVSRDPLALTGFVVALNLLAVLGAFWLGRRYWSMAAGLLAALLFAVSPWAVQHSRGVLGQDLLAPGVVALMLCTLAWFVDGRRWMLAASLAISGRADPDPLGRDRPGAVAGPAPALGADQPAAAGRLVAVSGSRWRWAWRWARCSTCPI
jgi:hypothetical protein